MFRGNVPGVMRLFHRLKQRPEQLERIFNRFLRPLFSLGISVMPNTGRFFCCKQPHRKIAQNSAVYDDADSER